MTTPCYNTRIHELITKMDNSSWFNHFSLCLWNMIGPLGLHLSVMHRAYSLYTKKKKKKNFLIKHQIITNTIEDFNLENKSSSQLSWNYFTICFCIINGFAKEIPNLDFRFLVFNQTWQNDPTLVLIIAFINKKKKKQLIPYKFYVARPWTRCVMICQETITIIYCFMIHLHELSLGYIFMLYITVFVLFT